MHRGHIFPWQHLAHIIYVFWVRIIAYCLCGMWRVANRYEGVCMRIACEAFILYTRIYWVAYTRVVISVHIGIPLRHIVGLY